MKEAEVFVIFGQLWATNFILSNKSFPRRMSELVASTSETSAPARFASHTSTAGSEEDVSNPQHKLAPFNPTDISAQQAGVKLLGLKSEDVLYDLGCGDGRKCAGGICITK